MRQDLDVGRQLHEVVDRGGCATLDDLLAARPLVDQDRPITRVSITPPGGSGTLLRPRRPAAYQGGHSTTAPLRRAHSSARRDDRHLAPDRRLCAPTPVQSRPATTCQTRSTACSPSLGNRAPSFHRQGSPCAGVRLSRCSPTWVSSAYPARGRRIARHP